MIVFISWSGTRSKALADSLRDWLPNVIQAIEPWMSEADIDKGTRWGIDLTNHLKDTKVGIICLTSENLESPWIHFEAGALSKTIESAYVCPYLFHVEPTDLTGPLVQFQAAKANKEDTHKLMHTINKALGDRALPEKQLNKSFEKYWPDFEENIKKIPEAQTKTESHRSDREVLNDLLQLVRNIDRGLGDISKVWVSKGDVDVSGNVKISGTEERLHGDVLEHMHSGYEYWHPASRLHK
ncbi:TIR domain protein [uncultured archaeon]|nr:TIR domain protein [uncultured archaeon]